MKARHFWIYQRCMTIQRVDVSRRSFVHRDRLCSLAKQRTMRLKVSAITNKGARPGK